MKQSQPKAVLFGSAVLSRLKKKESASTSSQPQLVRGKTKPLVKKSLKRESAHVRFVGHLLESSVATSGDGQRFRVTLLQEGLGNLSDCYYYTAQAIQSAPAIFEGKKLFVDHPTAYEEESHPERSVKDVAGYFENCAAEQDQDGVMNLTGDLVVMPGASFDQYRALLLEALTYSKKHPGQNLIGLSINANGDFDQVTLEQFIKTETIPDPAKSKLSLAVGQGITVIKPVREIKSAFSCDLVTEPGAGGSINSLLEGAKKMKQEENKAHEEEVKHKEGEEGDDGHADASQDKALIAKELKKHLGLGDDDEPSEEEAKLMHEAYEHSMEMEGEHEAAMKCAAANLKMAKHMQKKQMEADPAGQPEQKSKSKAVGDAGHVPPKEQVSKESNRGAHRDVALTAEVARLRNQLEALELEKHVESKLKESKLPMSATKRFKECIKGVRTKKEFDEKLNVFKEAFKLGGEVEGGGFILGVEKSVGSQSGEELSFADCVEE